VKLVAHYFRDLFRGTVAGWNRFWFTPTDPATLGIVRMLTGAMLFYTHLIWSFDLAGFFGRDGWITPEAMNKLPWHSPLEWSWFYWIDSPILLWCVHIACLCVFALLTIGLFSRTMSVLAFIATVSYINRVSLAQFGLDDTNAMLALYLMVGPCGAAYSVDAWRKRRRLNGQLSGAVGEGSVANAARSAQRFIEPSIAANIAIRLLQFNLCVEYFFAGIGKAQGEQWWNGNAVLMAVGNLEYQSYDLTGLIHYRWLASLLAHGTIFLEMSYCVLVWPRLTRPLVIAGAVAMHLGIGAFLGMWTFGLAMIIANVAFVSPWVVRRVLDRQPSRGGPNQGNVEQQSGGKQSRGTVRSPNGAQPSSLTSARK